MRSFFFDVVSTPFVHLAALFKTHQRWSPSSGGSALLCAGIEMATNRLGSFVEEPPAVGGYGGLVAKIAKSRFPRVQSHLNELHF